jgi:hypothetical protein
MNSQHLSNKRSRQNSRRHIACARQVHQIIRIIFGQPNLDRFGVFAHCFSMLKVEIKKGRRINVAPLNGLNGRRAFKGDNLCADLPCTELRQVTGTERDSGILKNGRAGLKRARRAGNHRRDNTWPCCGDCWNMVMSQPWLPVGFAFQGRNGRELHRKKQPPYSVLPRRISNQAGRSYKAGHA